MIRKEVAKLIKPSFYIAKVINTSPLTVSFEGIPLDSFYLNSNLVNNLYIGDEVIVLREADTFVISEKVINI